MYLDFNRKIWNESLQKLTRYHFLELFVFKTPKTQTERDHNKFVFEQAEIKKLDVYKQIITKTYGLKLTDSDKTSDLDFLEMFRDQIKLKKSNATRNNWENAYKHFIKFCGNKCLIRNLSVRYIREYKDYLDATGLAQNSKRGYFSVILTAISDLYSRDYIKEDISGKVKNFALKNSKRPFLTEDEIQILRKTPFKESPVLRRAAFFAILTSLRWDDLRHLTYEQLRYSKELGWFIDFEIRKTDRPDTLYINDEAFALCEYEKGKTGAIFPMRYREKDKVLEWFKMAQLGRTKGGFHIFRHTFAMRALNNGESLVAVKEMLGHKSIQTTENYARLLGKTKREASNRQSIEV